MPSLSVLSVTSILSGASMRLLPFHEDDRPSEPSPELSELPEDDDDVARDWQRVLVDVHLDSDETSGGVGTDDEDFPLDVEDDDFLIDD